ncbi:hypothetical protein E2C01_048245 [Portunus trituberculatus]|uniref:Uncharacterized protein n=1 Tax=Portunus trituberculatus TaxID=210409 RepID=A0A5B7GAB1_PORTR|nr:hypothetical protein [Portunus trituberculatus]
MRGRRKPCAATQQEERKHAVSIKIAIKYRRRYNISSMRQRLKTVSGSELMRIIHTGLDKALVRS